MVGTIWCPLFFFLCPWGKMPSETKLTFRCVCAEDCMLLVHSTGENSKAQKRKEFVSSASPSSLSPLALWGCSMSSLSKPIWPFAQRNKGTWSHRTLCADHTPSLLLPETQFSGNIIYLEGLIFALLHFIACILIFFVMFPDNRCGSWWVETCLNYTLKLALGVLLLA